MFLPLVPRRATLFLWKHAVRMYVVPRSNLKSSFSSYFWGDLWRPVTPECTQHTDQYNTTQIKRKPPPKKESLRKLSASKNSLARLVSLLCPSRPATTLLLSLFSARALGLERKRRGRGGKSGVCGRRGRGWSTSGARDQRFGPGGGVRGRERRVAEQRKQQRAHAPAPRRCPRPPVFRWQIQQRARLAEGQEGRVPQDVQSVAGLTGYD